MGLGVAVLLLSVALTTLFKTADAGSCHYCTGCGSDGYEADYNCMDSGIVDECNGGCYTELTCKADGSGDVCVLKDCIKYIANPVCLREKEFFPVVWASPEDSRDCSVTECCKGAVCNEYSGDRLQDAFKACCPYCKKCPVDLIFVADVSGSMDFDAVLAYMESTIPMFNPDKVRVGVVCFAADADTVLHLPQSITPLDFIEEDHNIGSTMIYLGIEEMTKEFLHHMIQDPTTARLGVVITDAGDQGPPGSIADSVEDALDAVTNLELVAVKVNDNDLSDISSVVIDIDDPQALVDMVDGLVAC